MYYLTPYNTILVRLLEKHPLKRLYSAPWGTDEKTIIIPSQMMGEG